MYIKQDMDFNDLMNNCWSGAIDTLKTIEEHNKEDELMEHLEEQWFDEVPTMIEINDYLWFEDEFIFECLEISESEDEEDEEEYIAGVTEKEMDDVNDMCDRYGEFGCGGCPYNLIKDCDKHFEEMKSA